jgi:hypothetical protein
VALLAPHGFGLGLTNMSIFMWFAAAKEGVACEAKRKADRKIKEETDRKANQEVDQRPSEEPSETHVNRYELIASKHYVIFTHDFL